MQAHEDTRLTFAIQDFRDADSDWQALLPKIANARYLPCGRGEPGSELRAAHDKRMEAMERHSAAWKLNRQLYG